MNRKAFTLIELLVVISIIGLLSSVVMTSLNSAREKGRTAAGKRFASALEHAAGDQAVAIWDFDECTGTTAGDRSGNANNGTLTNMATSSWSSDTPYSVGCSLSFDGSNDYLNITNESQFDFTDSTFTLSFWIKTTLTVDSFIIGKTVAGGGWGLSMSPAGTVGFLIKNSLNNNGNYNAGPVASNLANGMWHHIAAVVTTNTTVAANNNVVVYVDGQADSGSFSNGGFLYNPTNGNLEIGRRSTGNYYNGLLDGVRIYAKALTASEVGGLYAEGQKDVHVAYE